MTAGLGFICAACTRFQRWDASHPKAYCAAFPNGIPDSIIYGGADHRVHIDGDHGILFDLKPGQTSILNLLFPTANAPATPSVQKGQSK